jgi:hypothetical protein
MKSMPKPQPLSEWTRDELLVCVYESHPHAGSAMTELLRREREAMRERCADECRKVATYLRANGMPAFVHVTEACAAAIRELQ